jgi:hypothetical protein
MMTDRETWLWMALSGGDTCRCERWLWSGHGDGGCVCANMCGDLVYRNPMCALYMRLPEIYRRAVIRWRDALYIVLDPRSNDTLRANFEFLWCRSRWRVVCRVRGHTTTRVTAVPVGVRTVITSLHMVVVASGHRPPSGPGASEAFMVRSFASPLSALRSRLGSAPHESCAV